MLTDVLRSDLLSTMASASRAATVPMVTWLADPDVTRTRLPTDRPGEAPVCSAPYASVQDAMATITAPISFMTALQPQALCAPGSAEHPQVHAVVRRLMMTAAGARVRAGQAAQVAKSRTARRRSKGTQARQGR